MAQIFGSGSNPIIANGLDITIASNVLPVPVAYGRSLGGAVLIGAWDFAYHSNGSSSGGKGGSSKSGQPDYTATVLWSLGEGNGQVLPANIVEQIFVNNQEVSGSYWENQNSAFVINGAPNQEAWSYLVENHPADALNYRGIVLLGVANLNLGDSPVPPNYNFITHGLLSGTASAWAGPYDADFALVVEDLLTNAQYGVFGIASSAIDLTTLLSSSGAATTGDAALQTALRATGVAGCPRYDSREKASSIFDRMMQICNAAMGCWDGQLKFISRQDTTAIGAGVTYVPDTQPVVALTIDDFITDKPGDPFVTIDFADPEDLSNIVELEICDERNYLAPLPVPIRDEAAILTATPPGTNRINRVQAHEIVDRAHTAPLVANQILQRGLYITIKYSWKMAAASAAAFLTPMDIVTLTDSDSGLNVTPVRITSVSRDDKGAYSLQAENFPVGVGTGSAYGTTPTNPTTNPFGNDPGPVNVSPAIFEPTATLSGNVAQVWLLASGGFGGEANAYWGSAIINISVDGSTYDIYGEIPGPAAQGHLTAACASYSGASPDNTNTLSVNLTESGQTLSSYTEAAASTGASLCLVDNELLAFTTATPTAITFTVSELQTVPAAPGPYTVSVNNVGNWLADEGVTYTGGAALTKVTGTPTTGQYAVSAGNYTLSAGDAGAAVTISYSRSGAGVNLTGLYRGLYETTPAAHAIGANFTFVGSQAPIAKINLPLSFVGVTLYLKFQSVNEFGQAAQLLSECAVYEYVPLGTGYDQYAPLDNDVGQSMISDDGSIMLVPIGKF